MLNFEPWKIVMVCLIAFLGLAYATPNFLGSDATDNAPGWLPSQQVNLGLDLQGGSHLLLEVEVGAVVAEHMESLVDDARVQLRAERIGYTGLGLQGHTVVLQLRDATQNDAARSILRDIDPTSEVTIDDAGAVQISLTEAAKRERERNAVSQAIEIIRIRIDELGTNEPTIQRQGEDRILVQLPGLDDPKRAKDLIGETASLNFHMVDDVTPIPDALRGELPPGSVLLYEQGATKGEQGPPIVVRKRVSVSGENLVDAQATFQDGQPVVAIRFDGPGGRQFGKLTTDNVGKRFAVVLDDVVISAPVIREPIPGGSGIISGRFTTETANDLALLLRAGALPAPITILEERSVGPSLGADSIAQGKTASMVGLALVVVYMVMSYGLFGVASTIALAVNMSLILALLSVLQATLTLPGIAGIVLTVGMAVDANVLIFERIREEVRNGRTPYSAVDIGFQQALRAIIDANVTTLIAAVLLYQFGSGPVRGFAVTLGIGIFTSVFTAFMVTRMLIVLWLKRTRPQVLPV